MLSNNDRGVRGDLAGTVSLAPNRDHASLPPCNMQLRANARNLVCQGYDMDCCESEQSLGRRQFALVYLAALRGHHASEPVSRAEVEVIRCRFFGRGADANPTTRNADHPTIAALTPSDNSAG